MRLEKAYCDNRLMDQLTSDSKLGSTVADARFEILLDTVADGIVVTDGRGIVLAFNKACEELSGYAASEVIGTNVKRLLPDKHALELERYLTGYFENGQRDIIGRGREISGLHRNGDKIPLELSVGEAKTPDGVQFIAIVRDLRPRKAVEARVSALQADLVHLARVNAIDDMGAAIAHELNQPLTALLLYLQVANRKVAAEESADFLDSATRDILKKATREAERAGNIVQRMRRFIERREPQRKMASVNELIDEAVELVSLGSRANSVKILRQTPTDWQIPVDAVQIQQVLLNLLRNAKQAIGDRDEQWIKISTTKESGSITIAVNDSGPGISPDMEEVLFNAFSTASNNGVGLGLAISRTIAQIHGGDLTFHPGGSGSGATFYLQLPIEKYAAEKDEE